MDSSLAEILPSPVFDQLYLLGLTLDPSDIPGLSSGEVERVARSVEMKLAEIPQQFSNSAVEFALNRLQEEREQDWNMDNLDGSVSAECFKPLEKFLVLWTVVEGIRMWRSRFSKASTPDQDDDGLLRHVDLVRIFLRHKYLDEIAVSFHTQDIVLEAFSGWSYQNRLLNTKAPANSETEYYQERLITLCETKSELL